MWAFILLVSIGVIDYILMMKYKKQKTAFIIFGATAFPCIFAGAIAYGIYTVKFKKILNQNCQIVSLEPSDSSVDVFLNYVKQWGFYNHPEQWNQVRGVWFIVNESFNVSTSKKKELRDYLIINGLKLHNSEKQIIDNYSK